VTTPARAPEATGALETLVDEMAETPPMVRRRRVIAVTEAVPNGTAGLLRSTATAGPACTRGMPSGAGSRLRHPPRIRRRTEVLVVLVATD
jgi:hypothetical protein